MSLIFSKSSSRGVLALVCGDPAGTVATRVWNTKAKNMKGFQPKEKNHEKKSLLYFHKWLVKFTLLYVSESTSCLKSDFKLIRWLKWKSIKLLTFLVYFHRFLFNTPSLYTHVNWIICLWGFWVSTIIAAELSHFYNETQGSMTRRKRNWGGQRKRQ